MRFAKIFETTFGQLLIKLDAHEETGAPEVRFYVQPKDLGVCSLAVGYEDSDEGWDKAEAYFAKVEGWTQEKAEGYTREILISVSGASHNDQD